MHFFFAQSIEHMWMFLLTGAHVRPSPQEKTSQKSSLSLLNRLATEQGKGSTRRFSSRKDGVLAINSG